MGENEPGGRADGRTHLPGDHMRDRRLAQTRRPVKDRVIERLTALYGRLDADTERFLHPFLPDVLIERLRTQGGVHSALLLADMSADDSLRHGSREWALGIGQ